MRTVQELVQKYGKYTLRKGGQELIFSCPNCHRAKFEVNIKKNVYHCFRCGVAGKVWLEAGGGGRFYTEFTRETKVKDDTLKLDIKPPSPEMTAYLESRGVTWRRAEIIGAGGVSNWKFAHRVVVPIVEEGRLVAASARAINDEIKPKEIFVGEKSNVLYNLDCMNKWRNVVVTEGIFDAESVIRAGFNAVAILGSSMSEVQMGKLLAKRPFEVLLMLDNDEAGREGARRIFKNMKARFRGFIGMVHWKKNVMFSGWKDPGQCPTYVIEEAVRQFSFSNIDSWRGKEVA